MNIAKIKEILKPVNYHYSYSIDPQNKIVTEYRIYDYEEESEDLIPHFPYLECGYDDPYGLIYSSEWTCCDYNGNLIKEIDGVIV